MIPRGFAAYREALEAVVAVHRATRTVLEERGLVITGVADEGGWGPKLESNEMALNILIAAVERAGLVPGDQIALAIDAASTHFWRDGRYVLESEGRVLTSEEIVNLLESWSHIVCSVTKLSYRAFRKSQRRKNIFRVTPPSI